MIKKYFLSALIVLAFFLYILTLKGEGGNPVAEDIKGNLDQSTQPLELSPERGRFALVMSLVDTRSFALSRTLAEAVYPDVGQINGRFYTYFAPGISILAIPFYLAGYHFQLAQVFTFFSSAVFAVMNTIFICLIACRIFKLSDRAGLFAGLVFGFGSIAWPYAVTLYQHQATTFFLLSAFYAAWKFRQKTKFAWGYALWVWMAYGILLAIDYPNGILALPVMIYFGLGALDIRLSTTQVKVFFRPVFLVTGLVLVFLAGAHGYYNYIQFGSPLRLSGSLPGMKPVDVENIPPGEEEKGKNVVGFFRELNFPNGFYVLTISPDRGLVWYNPIFVLGFLGLFLKLKHDPDAEVSALAGSVGMFLFLYSSWGDPWGGWAFGPRYLIPALAVLSIFVSSFLESVGKQTYKILAFIFLAYSAGVSLLGGLTTIAVPPMSEALVLGSRYNFLFNWEYLLDNKSSSFIYKTFFSQIPLWQYALPIYLTVIAIAGGLLFVIPKGKQNDN